MEQGKPVLAGLRAAAVVAMGLMFVLGTSAGRAQDKEISIFTMQLKPMYTEYMEDLFRRFEAKHPGVKVKWLDYPAQGYETKLLSLIVSNQAPDVLNLSFQYMLTLNDRGLIMQLDDRLTSEQKGQYVQAVLKEGCTINGQLRSLPWYLATGVLMYNTEILEKAGLDPSKPPTTNEELFSMCRTIKEKTGVFGFLPTFTEDGAFKALFAGEGVPLTNPEMTKAAFNTPEGIRVVHEYKKLFDEGVIPRESMTAEHRRAIDLYKSGRVAFLPSGPQFLLIVKNEAPDVYARTGVGFQIPVKGSGKYAVDMQNLAIYEKTPHPKEALDLALWVTNAENQLAFCRLVTIFPSVEAALADPYFSSPGTTPEDKARYIGAQQLRNPTVLLPPLPKLSQLNKVFNDMARQVMLRNVPVEKAVAEAEAKWNEILAK
ncbi:MAG: sugar ABC transporter substrate-binding protein [Candidatus Sumerlaeaceae bacterium]|nr:sugar ABC transporter substrate-binding protein [Candidatus Sumerlaeaceae bacterium]